MYQMCSVNMNIYLSSYMCFYIYVQNVIISDHYSFQLQLSLHD